jgi:hypothetical protein
MLTTIVKGIFDDWLIDGLRSVPRRVRYRLRGRLDLSWFSPAYASPATLHRIPREGVNPLSHWPAVEQASALRARAVSKEIYYKGFIVVISYIVYLHRFI